MPAVEELIRSGRPISFFSDFCEEAVLRAADIVLAQGGKLLEFDSPRIQSLSIPVFVNPLRQPTRIVQTDNALPSYSNGFIFGFNQFA